MKAHKYMLEKAKKYFGDGSVIASKASEIKNSYIKALENHIKDKGKYLEDAKKEIISVISLDPIAFIQKYGVDKEEKRLEKDILNASYFAYISPYYHAGEYNPFLGSQAELVSYLNAKEEWEKMNNDDKLLVKLYEAIKINKGGIIFNKIKDSYSVGSSKKELISFELDDALFNFNFSSLNIIPEHDYNLFIETMKDFIEKYYNNKQEEKEL